MKIGMMKKKKFARNTVFHGASREAWSHAYARRNPNNDHPAIHKSAYIDPSAILIGNVRIGRDVYVGPHAVIRADEPESSITIKDRCNIQDSVIIHALKRTRVVIEKEVSLSHGCIVHGPCRIGKNSFVGFNSVVFNAVLGKSVFVKYLAAIENATVPSKRLVASGSSICSQEDASKLAAADISLLRFSMNVMNVNVRLAKGYKRCTAK